jgi:hypothetical protein
MDVETPAGGRGRSTDFPPEINNFENVDRGKDLWIYNLVTSDISSQQFIVHVS